MLLPAHSLAYLVLLGMQAFAASVSQTLTIGNADIAPDGFTRSYVELFVHSQAMGIDTSTRASLVNSAFPAPLITGNTVSSGVKLVNHDLNSCIGRQFSAERRE